MADIVVGPVIDKLIELLLEEAKLFKGVHSEVQSLTDELESIKCFLKDAESRSEKEESSSGLRIWVKQVKDEANRIEDVIDEYLRHVTPRLHQSRFSGLLQKTGVLIKRWKARRDIASEVEDIKMSIREIKQRSERYDLRKYSSEEGSGNKTTHVKHCGLDSLYIEEDEVVGIDSTRDNLIRKLVDGEPALRPVISLVGTGGIGKTTLASKVYKSEVVKKHFNCRAWITVSQSYNMEKLLKYVIKQICIGAECNKEEIDGIQELIDFSRHYLEKQRYLIVFDDVWDTDFWGVIKHALPRNDKGSRVIVTTRSDIIAKAACQEPSFDIVQKLEPLSEEMAWKLFCKKAFQSEPGNFCPKELEELSQKILDKCRGLPLVITAVACLLSTKEKILSEWQQVLDNMSSEFESNPHLSSILKILSLSFDDLPYHLKSCFLYFGVFPEDYKVSDLKLYTLWIAEGFVKPQRDKRLEDVAKEYLEELIHRNLVQVSYLECRGYDRMCKVHDLMREIILIKFEELGFCQILDEKNLRFRKKYRRLSINGSEKNVREIVEDSGVRSIFVFNVEELTTSFVVTLFKKFKLLRVLDFTDTPLCSLPKEVGNLFHLRFLGLRNTKVKRLPKSVGKLQNLQTLILSDTLVRELPFEISNLPSMRHLFDRYFDKKIGLNSVHGLKIPRGIGCLVDLQTLNIVEAHEGLGDIYELEKLTQLRSLFISKLTAENGKALCTSISKMNYLDRLYLSLISEDEILDLESISSPPRLLRFLTLRGLLEKLPNWISTLHNVLEIRLHSSKLPDDPLKMLDSLPNLQKLFLYQAYGGEEMHFQNGGFQKLKVVGLQSITELKVLKIDRGALPCLDMLIIGDCPLPEVPSDIQHLTNLKTLRFLDMSEEFVRGMRPDGGQDFQKVMHVSSVTFWETIDEGSIIWKLRESDPLNVCCAKHLKMT